MTCAAALSQSNLFSPPSPFSAARNRIIQMSTLIPLLHNASMGYQKKSFGLANSCRSHDLKVNPQISDALIPNAILDINQILATLPHRYPFVMVDRVIEHIPGVSAVGIKNVTINEHFFSGHLPGRPIMPGVLIVEAMAQVGALVLLHPEMRGHRVSGDNHVFAGANTIRFMKHVIAGDTLVMRTKLVKLLKHIGIAKMEGKAYVGNDLVCEGQFLFALDRH